MEILSPAGNPDSLKSAWAAGADAVYLGYSAFSARAGAGNFDAEQLRAALRFAHLHHMRVYVTVNTLLKDGELPEAVELIQWLGELKADGILIQDLGLLRLARERCPELPLHASTQMAIHNATGVRWCDRMGMRRVVLARECSLEEIRRCTRLGPEIEVFCHGAQCVAVSGECLFSSMVGGRSGNRGRCAQPCRMVYSFRGRKGAWLSPRDLCLRDEIPALAEAGVSSLKIEGRLKRPEYVAVVTSSYRQAADAEERGSFRSAGVTESAGLKQIFNRGGFMPGYAFGSEDAGVIFPESVQHQGIEIGRVEAVSGGLARVRLHGSLGDGDGIRFAGRGRTEADMLYTGKPGEPGEIALIRLRQGLKAEPGDRVLRLTDAAQLKAAAAMEGRKIRIWMTGEAVPGKMLQLTATDGETTVCVKGEMVEAAASRALIPEELARQFGKTGDTPFEAQEIRVEPENAFVPVSALNALRRAALRELEEKRIAAFEMAGNRAIAATTAPRQTEAGPALRSVSEDALPRVTVRSAEQARAAREAGETIAWYPEDFRPAALERLLREMRPGDWLRLPEVCEEETLEQLARWAEEHGDLLGGVVLGSVGQLGYDWKLPVGAGPGVPVMNCQAAALLAEQGCAFVTASPELTGRELSALLENHRAGCVVMTQVYGRTQLMLLHHCPARTALGLKQGHGACDLCDRGDERSLQGESLKDRKGYAFPLLRLRLREGCLVRLMNALETDLMDQQIPGQRALELTEETGAEADEILRCFREYRRTNGKTTRGHWIRETE